MVSESVGCPLYNVHRAATTTENMDVNWDPSKTNNECQLNEEQQKMLEHVYRELQTLAAVEMPSDQVLTKLTSCMKSVIEMKFYTIELVFLQFPTLVRLSSKVAPWSTDEKAQWERRIQTIMMVLCNNFGLQAPAVQESCAKLTQLLDFPPNAIYKSDASNEFHNFDEFNLIDLKEQIDALSGYPLKPYNSVDLNQRYSRYSWIPKSPKA